MLGSMALLPGSPGYAVCIWCGGNKGAAWLRCPRCERLPSAGAKLVMSRAFSQKYATVERLGELAEAARQGRPIEPRTSMVPPAPTEGPDLDAARVAGTVLVAKDTRRRFASIFELRTTDALCERREFLELAAKVALFVSRADDVDPSAVLESPEIAPDRRALEQRFAGRIEVARWQVLRVPEGEWLGTCELAHVPPESVREGRSRLLGNVVAAAAAIGTDPRLARRAELVDFANQVAEHVAMAAPADLAALLDQPFWLDPDFSVRDASTVVERAVGARIEISHLLRIERGVAAPLA
jgi:hypothetical protein